MIQFFFTFFTLGYMKNIYLRSTVNCLFVLSPPPVLVCELLANWQRCANNNAIAYWCYHHCTKDKYARLCLSCLSHCTWYSYDDECPPLPQDGKPCCTIEDGHNQHYPLLKRMRLRQISSIFKSKHYGGFWLKCCFCICISIESWNFLYRHVDWWFLRPGLENISLTFKSQWWILTHSLVCTAIWSTKCSVQSEVIGSWIGLSNGNRLLKEYNLWPKMRPNSVEYILQCKHKLCGW